MILWNFVCIVLMTAGFTLWGPFDATAGREILTAEEKAHLKEAERIHLETVALTDRGAVDATAVTAGVTARLKSFGYTVVTDPATTHDLTVKVKCEEHKVWEGTVTSGGDADQLDPASRLWKGPACQITYRLPKHRNDWRHEVRGEPADPKNVPTGDAALAQLTARLGNDPFPILLAGAWGQSPRLLKLLEQPATPKTHKILAISLLGNMFAVEAIPKLNEILKEKDADVVKSAALALGAIGHSDCIPLLQQLLKEKNADLRLAAIKGLGRLAPLYPTSDIVPTLLARLPRESTREQTEIVRALGKTTDRSILEPLRELNHTVQEKSRSDSSPELKELKRALGQSIDQFDSAHGGD